MTILPIAVLGCLPLVPAPLHTPLGTSEPEPVKVQVAMYMPLDAEEAGWEIALYPSGSVGGHINSVPFSAARLPTETLKRIRSLAECVFALPKPDLPLYPMMDPAVPHARFLVTVGTRQRQAAFDAQGSADLAVPNAWPTLALVREMCGLLGRPAGRQCRQWLQPHLARLQQPDDACAWLRGAP